MGMEGGKGGEVKELGAEAKEWNWPRSPGLFALEGELRRGKKQKSKEEEKKKNKAKGGEACFTLAIPYRGVPSEVGELKRSKKAMELRSRFGYIATTAAASRHAISMAAK